MTSDMFAESCKAMTSESYVADLSGRTIRLPRGSSDAALAPYHVDRSKLFVSERLDGADEVDARPNCAGHRIYALSLYAVLENDDDWSKRRACCCARPI